MNREINRAIVSAWTAVVGVVSMAATSEASGQESDVMAPPLEEVVVTALKRTQTAFEAPISLSVVSGESLRDSGIINAQNLPDVLPNVQNGVAGFSIRGVSSGDTTEKGDPSTAFNLDGVNIARPQQQALSFFDVERVEVLRGPQGTLYGRNATAGAINVITNRPQPTFEGSASVERANYDTTRATGVVNVPVTESLALRAAVAYNQHDGYTPTANGRPDLDDQDDLAARLRALVKFGDSTSWLITGDTSSANGDGPAYVPIARVLAGGNKRLQSPGGNGSVDLDVKGFTSEFSTNLGFADLVHVFGYRSADDAFTQFFGDNGPSVIQNNDHEQDSHELRLTSASGSPLEWVAGLFYFHERTHTTPIVNIAPTLQLAFDLNSRAVSKAAFAQATYPIFDAFRLTAGLRYTEDEKARAGTSNVNGGPPILYDAAVSYDKWNWKLGFEYDLMSDTILYGSVSTGYKAGGFNDGTAATQPSLYYDPEDLRAYEVGAKVRAFSDRLEISSAVFLYDYSNLQLSSVPPTGGILTLNAAKADIRGVEVEGALRVLQAGRLNFNLTFLDASYDEYLPLGAGGPDYADKSLDSAPETTGRIGYLQNFDLTGGGRVAAEVATRYSSSYYITDFNVPMQYRQPSYWRSDLTVSYYAPQDRWFVQAFGRNLEDSTTFTRLQFNSFKLGEPRLYGVRAGLNF